MTHEAQNRAICEAMGRRWHRPTPDELESGSYYQYEPDFTRDLNAVHEAEKVLTPEQRREYIGKISDQAGEPWTHPVVSCPKSVSATAAQRSEALLRTLNKWDDSL